MYNIMSITYRELLPSDLDAALLIWSMSEGIGLSDADSIKRLERFLIRNPGLSYVAVENGKVVAAMLCGHDGRRGYLHHLAVTTTHRREGIGRALVEYCLKALRVDGIMKCHLFIFDSNIGGLEFWRAIGWTHREELAMMSAWTS